MVDPLFLLFPVVTLAVSAGAFLVFAMPLSLLAWWAPAWTAPYRIQPVSRSVRMDLRHGLTSWALNHAVMAVVVTLLWPVLRLSGVHAGPVPDVPVLVAQVVLFLYVDDVLYWFLHRAMHTPRLFRAVHRVHHRSRSPIAILGLHMHPIEFVLTAGLAMLLPTLLGAHVVTLWVWIALRQWQAAEGHSGFEFPWNPSFLFPGYGGVAHHDRHHADFDCNYAGFLAWFDRAVGTSRSVGRRGGRSDVDRSSRAE